MSWTLFCNIGSATRPFGHWRNGGGSLLSMEGRPVVADVDVSRGEVSRGYQSALASTHVDGLCRQGTLVAHPALRITPACHHHDHPHSEHDMYSKRTVAAYGSAARYSMLARYTSGIASFPVHDGKSTPLFIYFPSKRRISCLFWPPRAQQESVQPTSLKHDPSFQADHAS